MYIHCQGGISRYSLFAADIPLEILYVYLLRSTTILLSYLVKRKGMKLIDAFKLVHAKRDCISPNQGKIGNFFVVQQMTLCTIANTQISVFFPRSN